MSVDTNTEGKNLSPYERVEYHGVAFLVPRNLIGWAATLTVDATRGLLGSKFVIEAGHAHGPG